MRKNNRGEKKIREVSIKTNVNMYAEGSCLITCGNTKVLCTASVDDKLPAWLNGADKGWISAEYSLLPRSTHTRVSRETKGVSGRTHEIHKGSLLSHNAMYCAGQQYYYYQKMEYHS